MSDYNIVFEKDMNEESYSEKFFTIKEKNEKLYDSIMENLHRDSSLGIREDVLDYISQNIDEFGTDQEYVFNIAALACNIKISAEHLKLVNEIFGISATSEVDFKNSDFMIIFTEAVEKDIPISTLNSIFNSGGEITSIYEKIVEWAPEGKDALITNALPDEYPDQSTSKTIKSETNLSTTVENIYGQGNMNDPGYADMFNSLVTAMSCRDKKVDGSVLNIQERFNRVIAKFQLAVTEISAYSSEAIHDIEKGKLEIDRLNTLLKLQQQVMTNQQHKINEMSGEITRLNSIIQEAKKTAMQRKEINDKISELQALTIASNSSQC